MDTANSFSVLFVDDEPSFLHSILRSLRSYKRFSVTTADSAEAAFECLKKKEIDIVFSDLKMPKMRGDAFLSEVGKKYPATYRALFTGYPEFPSIAKLVNTGQIDRLYLKPYDITGLGRELDHIVKSIQNRQDGPSLDVSERKQEINDAFASIITIGNALNRERDPEKLFRLILETIVRMTEADAGTIYYVEQNAHEKKLRIKYAINHSLNIPYEEHVMPVSVKSVAGYVALSGMIVNIPDVRRIPKDAPYRFNDFFDIKFGYRTVSMLTIPLINQRDEILGVIQLINKMGKAEQHEKIRAFDSRFESLLMAIANQAAIALDNVNLIEKQKRQFEEFIRSAVKAIEARDPATAGHSERVSGLALMLARRVGAGTAGFAKDDGFSPNDLKELEYAALLHDFGKVYIDPSLFIKAKKLQPWDYNFLKSRFEYLYAVIEMEYLRREVILHKRVKGKDLLREFLDEISDEKAQMYNSVASLWNEIEELNEPDLVDRENAKRLEQIKRQIEVYASANVSKTALPVLDEGMIENLSIHRGTLNRGEKEIIQNHVEYTYRFVKTIPWPAYLSRIPEICRNHHEFLDGSGYPRGIQAEQISIQSRVITVADIYDALTAGDRPYKKAVPHATALRILQDEADKNHVDRRIVEILKTL